MRIRAGDVAQPAEQQLLRDYFTFRASSFPQAGGYTVALPDPAQFDGRRGVFLVVEDDEGVPVGCGGIRMLAPDPARDAGAMRAEVKHVWLDPSTRGRGWAVELLAALETSARALGATELVLDTHHTLEAAARLYARSGFVPTDPYNDNPNATRWYRKPLEDSAAGTAADERR
jgi:ribosomal protein S18 acetylase RimI-like enzyme